MSPHSARDERYSVHGRQYTYRLRCRRISTAVFITVSRAKGTVPMNRRKVPIISCPNWDVEEKTPHKPIILGWKEARKKPYGLYGVVIPRPRNCKARFVQSNAASFRKRLDYACITYDFYRWLLDQQEGRCGGCRKEHGKWGFWPDDHAGRVWGVLCGRCLRDVQELRQRIHGLKGREKKLWKFKWKGEIPPEAFAYLDSPDPGIPEEFLTVYPRKRNSKKKADDQQASSR